MQNGIAVSDSTTSSNQGTNHLDLVEETNALTLSSPSLDALGRGTVNHDDDVGVLLPPPPPVKAVVMSRGPLSAPADNLSSVPTNESESAYVTRIVHYLESQHYCTLNVAQVRFNVPTSTVLTTPILNLLQNDSRLITFFKKGAFWVHLAPPSTSTVATTAAATPTDVAPTAATFHTQLRDFVASRGGAVDLPTIGNHFPRARTPSYTGPSTVVGNLYNYKSLAYEVTAAKLFYVPNNTFSGMVYLSLPPQAASGGGGRGDVSGSGGGVGGGGGEGTSKKEKTTTTTTRVPLAHAAVTPISSQQPPPPPSVPYINVSEAEFFAELRAYVSVFAEPQTLPSVAMLFPTRVPLTWDHKKGTSGKLRIYNHRGDTFKEACISAGLTLIEKKGKNGKMTFLSVPKVPLVGGPTFPLVGGPKMALVGGIPPRVAAVGRVLPKMAVVTGSGVTASVATGSGVTASVTAVPKVFLGGAKAPAGVGMSKTKVIVSKAVSKRAEAAWKEIEAAEALAVSTRLAISAADAACWNTMAAQSHFLRAGIINPEDC